MTGRSSDEVGDDLVGVVARSLFPEALRSGEVSIADKSDEEAREVLLSFLQHVLDNEDKFGLIFDHRDSLLGSATDARLRGEREVALVLFATWC